MQALLATIVIWLSVNFGLPATGPVPSIRFVSAMELAFLHYEAFTPAAQAKVVAMYAAQPAGSEREVLSVYDHQTTPYCCPPDGLARRRLKCRCWSTKRCITCRPLLERTTPAPKSASNSPMPRRRSG